MKREFYIKSALVVVGLLSAVSVNGQSANPPLYASIPFQFSAGNQLMPAGMYEITIVNPNSDQRAVKLRALEAGQIQILLMHTAVGDKNQQGRLVFRRYGEQYFLKQAWSPGEAVGMEAPRSRAEKSAAAKPSLAKWKTENIALRRR